MTYKYHTGSIGKRHLVVNEPIFNRTVHVLLNHSGADWDQWCKKRFKAEPTDTENTNNFSAWSCSITPDDGPDEYVILIKHFDWTIKDQAALIHEIVHTVVKIWAANNIAFGPTTQEFLAHSIDKLFEVIARRIWRIPRRKGRKKK